MRPKLFAVTVAVALLAGCLAAGSAQAAPQAKVYRPHMKPLGKDPAVVRRPDPQIVMRSKRLVGDE